MSIEKKGEDVRRAYVSPEEARRVLSVGRSTIYALIHSGQVPAIRLGRLLRIPVAALEELAVSARDFYTIGPPVGDECVGEDAEVQS
jgi:excisionase family DNA binding protein